MPYREPIAVNPGIRQLSPGDHMCLICEDLEQWREVIPPYIELGLKYGQRSLYLGEEHKANQIRCYLREMGWDVESLERSERLSLISKPPLAIGSELQVLIEYLRSQVEKTKCMGYGVLRFAQEISLLLGGTMRWPELIDYEMALNQEICSREPIVIVCHYQSWKLSQDGLKHVVTNHPLIARSGKIFYNSYYVEPANDLKLELDNWLKKIESANESRRRLEFLVELTEKSSQPYMVVDKNGFILTFNPAFAQLIGYDADEAKQLNWVSDLSPYQWWEMEWDLLAGLADSHEPKKFTMEMIRKDGSRVPVEVSTESIRISKSGPRVLYALVTDITERLLMERKLDSTEARYRSLVNNMQEGIYLLGPDMRAVFYNPAMEKIYGRSVTYLIKNHPQSFLECVHPEDRERVARTLYHDVHLYERVETTYRVLRPSGECRYLKDMLYMVRDKRGEITGYQGLVMDITEQLLSQMALKESEARLRQITDNMLDMIWKTDADGRFEWVSPSNYSTMGYVPDQILGTHFLEYVHPDDLDGLLSRLDTLRSTKTSGIVEFRFRDASGNYRWLESAGNLLYDEKGKLTGAIFACRDISQRKAAEEALRMAEQEKGIILEAMSELVVHMDTTLNVIWANPVAKNWGKASKIGLEGNKCYHAWYGKDEPCAGCLALQTLASGKALKGETIGKDGRVWLEHTYPVWGAGNELVGVVLLAMDITDRKRMEEEMVRLQQLNLVGEMAAGIGHEIRNPMTTVRGFLQLMSTEDTFKDYTDHFDLMIEELDRANSIITEFLSLAKDRTINLRMNNLNRVIAAIYPLMAAEAIKEDKDIVTSLEDIPDILLDEKQIRQLILNLVRNGLEAMEPGGKLTISTRLENGEVVLGVRDQGSGIDESILNSMWTPFFTTKDNGTGLGLPVCYSIAVRHNARIDVETGPGGTEFKVVFKSSPSGTN